VFCYVLSGATGLATLYGQLESLALGMTDVLETLRQERHSFRYYLLGIIPAFLQMDGSTTNMRQLNAGLQFIRELRSHCNLYKPQHIILCNEARMFGHSFFRIADVAVTRDFLETLTHDFTRFGPETWANCGSIPLGS
jgi:hypothetical protein